MYVLVLPTYTGEPNKANNVQWWQSVRAHDESAATVCRLHAVGNQLQTEQRSTASSGTGGADGRPGWSLFSTQGKMSYICNVRQEIYV